MYLKIVQVGEEKRVERKKGEGVGGVGRGTEIFLSP